MGKSISTSLEDEEDLLIRTNTPGGPIKSGSKTKQNSYNNTSLMPYQSKSIQQQSTPGIHRQPSTQERPPSSIFKVDPLVLSSGYLRDIVKIEDIKIDIIPTSIYQLCKNYYIKKYNNMHLDSNNILLKQLIVNKIDDQSYDDIELGHDTSILGIYLYMIYIDYIVYIDCNAF